MTTGWVAVDVSAISDRWRPLSLAEMMVGQTIIQDAQDILEEALESVGVTGPPPGNERWIRSFTRVVGTMARRVMQNPEGLLSETIDDYTYRRDAAVSAGHLYVSDAERDSLIPTRRRRRGAFTITPS